MSSQCVANWSKLGWKKGGGERKKDLLAIPIHSGICSRPPGFQGTTAPWQIEVVNVEANSALQLGGLQAAKADHEVSFVSVQGFQEFGWCSFCFELLPWLLALFSAPLQLSFLGLLHIWTSFLLLLCLVQCFSFSYVKRNFTKINLVLAEEAFCFCIRYPFSF